MQVRFMVWAFQSLSLSYSTKYMVWTGPRFTASMAPPMLKYPWRIYWSLVLSVLTGDCMRWRIYMLFLGMFSISKIRRWGYILHLVLACTIWKKQRNAIIWNRVDHHPDQEAWKGNAKTMKIQGIIKKDRENRRKKRKGKTKLTGRHEEPPIAHLPRQPFPSEAHVFCFAPRSHHVALCYT